MACTDATGAPTALGICKYNTSADAPSGLGFNAVMDQLDALIAARVGKPSGIAAGEAPVWNGSGWDRSSVTKLGTGSLSGYPWANADIAAAAAIAISKLASYPSDGTKALFGDGTWKVPSGAVAPTHLTAGMTADSSTLTFTANQAYLIPIPNLTTAITLTRLFLQITAASGNMDLGFYYSDDEITFTRLFSTGSFAVPASNAQMQTKTIASTTLTPVAGRRWFFGWAVDNGTAQFSGFAASSARSWIPSYIKATSFPLPASLTGMTGPGPITNLPVFYGAV